jgi:hypothetical protein
VYDGSHFPPHSHLQIPPQQARPGGTPQRALCHSHLPRGQAVRWPRTGLSCQPGSNCKPGQREGTTDTPQRDPSKGQGMHPHPQTVTEGHSQGSGSGKRKPQAKKCVQSAGVRLLGT